MDGDHQRALFAQAVLPAAVQERRPERGHHVLLGDSGPSAIDQRRVVDPSFLELVRLGVERASNPAVRNTLKVVDAQLGVQTPEGLLWHRYSQDGYGETATGAPWGINPPDTYLTRGRLWVLLAGERGEYDLLAGHPAAARQELATMAGAATPSYFLSEQVWDNHPPAASPASRPAPPPCRPPRSAGPRRSSSGWPGLSRRAARSSSQPPSPAGTLAAPGSRAAGRAVHFLAVSRLRPGAARPRPAEEPVFVGEDDRLNPVTQAELGEQAGHVGLDGGWLDDELGGDLGVGQAARQQAQHVVLAGGQPGQGRRLDEAAGRTARSAGGC